MHSPSHTDLATPKDASHSQAQDLAENATGSAGEMGKHRKLSLSYIQASFPDPHPLTQLYIGGNLLTTGNRHFPLHLKA